MAVVLVLLHVSIVSILLLSPWLKRRASRRSTREAVTEGEQASQLTVPLGGD